MGLESIFDDGTGGFLMKVGAFVLVQALVYLILSSSTTVFSEEKTAARLRSFQRVRTLSIRRAFAGLSNLPQGREVSPSAARMPTIPEAHDEHHREGDY